MRIYNFLISPQLFLGAVTLTALLCSPVHAQVPIRVGSGIFEPQQQKSLRADSKQFSLTTRRAGRQLELVVTPRTGAAFTIALPDEFAQATTLRIVDQQAVVMAWMNGALATGVAVIDLAAGKIDDVFWAYEPSLSPTGRQIAFVKFYPSHFVTGWESQYRLYDLSRTPTENREAGLAKGGSAAPDKLIDVGMPLYSLTPGEVNRANVDVPEGQEHIHRSRIFWSSDGKRLAFIDAQKAIVRLITAEVGGPDQAQTRVYEIPAAQSRCLGNPIAAGCRFIPVEGFLLSVGIDRVAVNTITADDLPVRLFEVRIAQFQAP